ncbi:MAG: DUF1810 domain-containing protein [Tepidisphaeraceae bacterium]
MDEASFDPHDLHRFVEAQEDVYPYALAELKAGRKQTHWMWFIFPQMGGLGHSSMAHRYAIRSLEQAKAYLAHPLLGARLIECAEAVLAVQGKSAREIMGSPDDLKLRSSATLFAKCFRRGRSSTSCSIATTTGNPTRSRFGC